MPKLQEVFGINTQVRPLSYVDRGGLDERLTYLLGTERHVSIYGDTKQGKSWLRRKVLKDSDSVVVQCTTDSSFETIMKDVLGLLKVDAPGRTTRGSDWTASATGSASGSA